LSGLKKRIESLNQQITKHKSKIMAEQTKPVSDKGKIHHWEAEIEAFNNSLAKALKRLNK
jgi:peptidoglycan hydrolase CwlO-like protein